MTSRWATIVAGLLLPLLPAAHAAGLQISQFAYNSPDLLVFVDRGEGAPAVANNPGTAPMKAALGERTLQVKSAVAWRPESGVAVVVAVDVSGSMRTVNFPAIMRALAGVLDSLPPASSVALMTIGAAVQVQTPFGPVAAARSALDQLVADAPETALNEGVLRAQQLAAMQQHGKASPALPLRRIVVLVTDGLDESKRAIGSVEMLNAVQVGDVPVYTAAVTNSRQRVAGLEPLANVARASGGSFVQTSPARVADELAALVRDALRVDLVTIDCRPCTRDGMARKLQLSMPSGSAIVSDVRDVRLFAEPRAETTVRPAPEPKDERDWFTRFKQQVERVMPWRLFLALLFLLVPTAGTGGYVYRRQIKIVVYRWLRLPPPPPPTTSVDPPGPVRPAATGKMDLTIDVAGSGRRPVTVGTSDVVLGRSSKADVVAPKDSEASSRHAALYLEKAILMVRDLGSANGTFLNGTPIVRPEPIHDHDVVRIGRTDMKIYFGRL